MFEQLEEVASHHRLTATDVDVEHLQVTKFVEHSLGLLSREFARISGATRREAMDALEIAGIRQLPRETDGGIKSLLHLRGK
jgi:hypothetical protein